MTDPARAERLWLALAVATFWVVSVGDATEHDLARPVLADLVPGPGRPRRVRLFHLGRLALLAALALAQPLPLPASLSADAWPDQPPGRRSSYPTTSSAA